MGTDIHTAIEKRQADGSWKFVNVPLETWRCYDVFAILADVRNGYGFAGCYTGEGFNPISEPKGLPTDCKYDRVNYSYDDDYLYLGDHSFSWLTLRELKEYDYDQETVLSGVLSEQEYIKWKEAGGGFPKNGYSGGVSGWAVREVTPQEMDLILTGEKSREVIDPNDGVLHPSVAVKTKPTPASYYTRVEWPIKYREVAGMILEHIIPAMESVAEGDLDSVRLVFGFDS